jgi:nucleoid-associated protein YgaU
LPAPFTPNGGGASGGQGQRERAVAGTPGGTGPEQSPDQWIDDPTAPGRDGVRGKPVSTGVERQHTVASGDNFYKLAQAYYKDASLHTALAQYNRGVSATSMKVGMVVKIPPKDVLQGKAVLGPVVPPTPPAPMARRDGATPARPDAKPETKPEARNPGRTYVVQPGDTFGKIAKALLGDERRRQEIADLNPDANPTNLRVGMTLKLPSK